MIDINKLLLSSRMIGFVNLIGLWYTPFPASPIFDFLTYECTGPYHCWLNFGESKDSFKRLGTLLVVAGQFLDNSIIDSNSLSMLLKVKSLQQR